MRFSKLNMRKYVYSKRLSSLRLNRVQSKVKHHKKIRRKNYTSRNYLTICLLTLRNIGN